MKIPNCKVHLGDGPMNNALVKALSKLSWFQAVKLSWHLLTSKDSVRKLIISLSLLIRLLFSFFCDIENCKKPDMLEQLVTELLEIIQLLEKSCHSKEMAFFTSTAKT